MASQSREVGTEVLGRPVSFTYSKTWVGYSLLSLRLVMGWVFLQAGITKLLDPEWTAAGYLENAVPPGNPFGDVWVALAGAPLVDVLNVWGAILIGLALLVGAFVRLSAFFGSLMMLFYWASHLEGGLLAGLPLENGYVISSHIVYVLLLFGLGAFGAGRILGVDAVLERAAVVRANPWIGYLLG